MPRLRWCVWCALLIFAPQNRAQGSKTSSLKADTISVDLRMSSNRVTSAKDAKAVIRVENVSKELVSYGLPQYRIHLLGPAGEPPRSKWYQDLLDGKLTVTLSAEPRLIAPGQNIPWTFILDSFYPSMQLGRYTLYVELPDETGAWRATNEATFEVVAQH